MCGVSTVLGAIVLVLILTKEAISAYRFLKVEGSHMRGFYCIRSNCSGSDFNERSNFSL